jgi:hypothetical protein
MQKMDTRQTWRKLLGEIIADTHERQRLAAFLSVNPLSLTRWAQSETNPRPQNLQGLIKSVSPKYREQLFEAILQEFPDIAITIEDPGQADLAEKIPSDFYESVLDAYAQTRKEQRMFTVSNRVLTKALAQLDPNRLGMALSIALCMPPSTDRKIRSLHEVTGVATPPWQSTLTLEALFLGIESLAGYAVTKGRSFMAEKQGGQLGFLPVRWEEREESTIACPIWFENRIAGCLVASSTQSGYFLPFRQTLVERYAQLLTLALDPEDFYEQDDIELLPMPARDVQRKKVADYRQRLSQIILQANRQGQPMSIEKAERQVWQQLEGELLDQLVPGYE